MAIVTDQYLAGHPILQIICASLIITEPVFRMARARINHSA